MEVIREGMEAREVDEVMIRDRKGWRNIRVTDLTYVG